LASSLTRAFMRTADYRRTIDDALAKRDLAGAASPETAARWFRVQGTSRCSVSEIESSRSTTPEGRWTAPVQALQRLPRAQHAHRASDRAGKVSGVSRYQGAILRRQGNLQEHEVVWIWRSSANPGLRDHEIVQSEYGKERFSLRLGDSEPRPGENLAVLRSNAIVVDEAQHAREGGIDQAPGWTASREEPRHHDVRVEHPPDRRHGQRDRRVFRAATISRSISAEVSRAVPRAAASRRMALTARLARARICAARSSKSVSSLVGSKIARGFPSLVMTSDPSRSRSPQTLPGRAASTRDETIRMLNTCTSNRRASSPLLRRDVLRTYLAYYHRSRCHLALGRDAPDGRAVQGPERGKVIAFPEVGGLHHRYERRAA